MKFKETNRIIIDDNEIKQDEKVIDNTKINTSICGENRAEFFKIGISVSKSRINTLVFVVSLILVLFYALYAHIECTFNFTTDVIAMTEDVIIAYKGEYVYGELNEVYVKSAGLTIDPDRYYRGITYQDIPTIAGINGVEKIIISDCRYLDKIKVEDYKDSRREMLDDLYALSIPEVVTSERDFFEIMWPREVMYLEKGRFPFDGKEEVSISKALLKKYFGYDDEMIENAIGNTIDFKGKEYKIVGLQYTDTPTLAYLIFHNFY